MEAIAISIHRGDFVLAIQAFRLCHSKKTQK
jgi:hypothetical protein